MNRKPLLSRRLLLCTTVCTFMSGTLSLHAQLIKNFATQQIAHSTGAAFSSTFNVPDYANASDTNLATSATLNAETQLLVFSNDSYVEVGFTANVPAGSTLYIPVQDDQTQGLLSTLAGGTIGNIVTGLLGDKSFQVQIKTATATLVTYNSANNGTRTFAEGTFNVVQDAAGQSYITFRSNPGVSYSRVRITASTSGLVSATYQLKVQDAYYLSGSATPCDPFLTTAFDATGLTVGVLNGNGAPVKNAQRVIDTDTTNFSTYGYGTLSVGALSDISQDVYFSNLSKTGDQPKIKFRIPQSLLSLGVLGNITVTTYRNDTVVASSSLSSILNLQALGILELSLNNNLPAYVQVPVPGNAQFNRVRVSYTPLSAAGANQLLELYGVDRVPPSPTVSIPAGVSCPATTLRLSVSNVTAGVSYAWRNSSGTVVSNDSFYVATVPANGMTDTFYVTASDCPGKESVGTMAMVTGSTANCVSVSPISFLQGAFDIGLNRNKDVTPTWASILAANATAQPYSGAPFNYMGTESVAASIFTSTAADDDILDWMLLELKDSSGILIDRKAVFILENGNITNIDKSPSIVLKANPGRYHLTIRHRNHLGLSTVLTPMESGTNSFNFTTATDTALFGDADAYRTMNGMTVMIAGNANSNGFISYSGSGNDRAVMLSVLGGSNSNVVSPVYSSSDLNLSGSVYYTGSGNDRAIILNALGGNVNGVITEQIK